MCAKHKIKYLFTSKKLAFTLTEVLITLGIVGVLAAIIIPTLITNYQKYVTVQQLKIAYKLFSDVLEQAKADNDGVLLLTAETRKGNLYGSNDTVFSKVYIEPYLKTTEKIIKKYNITNAAKNHSFITCASPPLCTTKKFCYWISINQSNSDPTSDLIHSVMLTVDLNGSKGPNRAGRDVFMFYYNVNNKKKIIDKFSLGSASSREALKNYCNSTSNSIWNGSSCANLIIKDNWEIAPDYPW